MNVEDRLREHLRHAALGSPDASELPQPVARRARVRRAVSALLASTTAAAFVGGGLVVARQIADRTDVASRLSGCMPADPEVRGSVAIERTGALTDVAVGAGAAWVATGALSRYVPGDDRARTVALPAVDPGDSVNVWRVVASCDEVFAFGAIDRASAGGSLPAGRGGRAGQVVSKGAWLWRVDGETLKSDAPVALDGPVLDAIWTSRAVWFVAGQALYRIRPGSAAVERMFTVADRVPTTIAADDREVWVLTTEAEPSCPPGAKCLMPAAEVHRLDATTGLKTATYGLTIAATAGESGTMALDEDHVWIAAATPGSLVRIDRDSGASRLVTFGARFPITEVRVAAGYVWAMMYDAQSDGVDGYLQRVLPATGVAHVRDRVAPGFPLAMSIGGTTAWIMDGRLYWEPLLGEIPIEGEPVPGTSAVVNGRTMAPLHEGQILGRVSRRNDGTCDVTGVEVVPASEADVRLAWTAGCLVYVKKMQRPPLASPVTRPTRS